MTMKVTLPPIPNSVNSNSRDLGSFDPFAFRKQFSKGYQYTAYKEIAQLSSTIESLQKENAMMRSELYGLVTTQDSPYCQMKRNILEFEARITEREKEAAAVKKYYNGSSVSSTPTFVEVDIHKDKQASFDLVATSLLVCNEQRTFFKANDLRRQNEELLALIEHQQEALKMAQSRLHLYWQCQHKNGTQLTIDSLKRGISPPELADAAPNQLTEQKMKIKILSNELRRLVAQRKELAENGAFKNRIKIHAKQWRNEMAIKIQKLVRGFLARMHSPIPRKKKPSKQGENQLHAVHEPPKGKTKPHRNNKVNDDANNNNDQISNNPEINQNAESNDASENNNNNANTEIVNNTENVDSSNNVAENNENNENTEETNNPDNNPNDSNENAEISNNEQHQEEPVENENAQEINNGDVVENEPQTQE